jgi:hypothetical protein
MTAPNYYQQSFTRSQTNSWAIAALVCAIVGFFAFPAEILAIIFGHIARGQIRRTGEGGAGMALAGLIIGYVTLLLGIVATVIVLVFFVAVSHSDFGTSTSVTFGG